MPSPMMPLSTENETMVGVVGVEIFIVTAATAEAAPVLPAASVAVAVKLCVPLANPAVVYAQAPLPFALALPSRVAPSNTLTVLLASAVPLRATSLKLTIALLTIEGAIGAVASTVTLSAADAVPVLPAASVAVAVRLWAPLASAAVV